MLLSEYYYQNIAIRIYLLEYWYQTIAIRFSWYCNIDIPVLLSEYCYQHITMILLISEYYSRYSTNKILISEYYSRQISIRLLITIAIGFRIYQASVWSSRKIQFNYSHSSTISCICLTVLFILAGKELNTKIILICIYSYTLHPVLAAILTRVFELKAVPRLKIGIIAQILEIILDTTLLFLRWNLSLKFWYNLIFHFNVHTRSTWIYVSLHRVENITFWLGVIIKLSETFLNINRK